MNRSRKWLRGLSALVVSMVVMVGPATSVFASPAGPDAGPAGSGHLSRPVIDKGPAVVTKVVHAATSTLGYWIAIGILASLLAIAVAGAALAFRRRLPLHPVV